MEKNLQAPDRIRYPKKTSMVIKKTSLMIDELELRREEGPQQRPQTGS